MHKKQERSKRHHYVPKALIRKFSPNGKNIYYATRDNTNTGYKDNPFKQINFNNIDKTFCEKDLYTIVQNSRLSDAIEREFYMKFDDGLGKFVTEIIDHLDSGSAPRFYGDALEELRHMFYHMMNRSADWVARFNRIELGEKLANDLIKGGLADHPDLDDHTKRVIMKEPTALKHAGYDLFNRARASRPGERILAELSEMEIRFAKTPEMSSFILPSRGVVPASNGGTTGLGNKKVEMWLPISPRYVMILLRDPFNKIPQMNRLSKAKVKEFNEVAASNSSAVGSNSLQVICRVLGQNYRSTRRVIESIRKK